MKTVVFSLLALVSGSQFTHAQLTNGSTAPDFTLTDINGATHRLYDYLDAGKTVYIDFFAAHCPTCWNYKNAGHLSNLYTSYGPGGTDEVMVIAIELDPNNGSNELNGVSGWTQGDWVTPTPYPIINPEGSERTSIIATYAANYYPMIYGICPNRSVKLVGTATTANLYAYHTNDCEALNLDEATATDFFEVKGENIHFLSNGKFTITDLSGRVFMQEHEVNEGDQLSLSEQNNGLYLLLLEKDQRIYTQKILVP